MLLSSVCKLYYAHGMCNMNASDTLVLHSVSESV